MDSMEDKNVEFFPKAEHKSLGRNREVRISSP